VPVERFVFPVYLAAVSGLTAVHHAGLLGATAFLMVMRSPRTALRTLRAILLFNLGVTLGYLIQMLWTGEGEWLFLLRFNLRVFVITFLTLYLIPRINVAGALAFSPTLLFLYQASLSQIETFVRTYREFMLALRSRTLKPLSERNRREFVGAMLYHFLKKSLNNSKERTQALKARGFFDHTD